MSMEASTKIVNYMTSGKWVAVLGRGQIGHKVKLHYFFKNLLLYSWVSCRQSKCKVMISMEASTKTVNYVTPSAGVPVLGFSHTGHIVKMHYFFDNLLYSWLLCRETSA